MHKEIDGAEWLMRVSYVKSVFQNYSNFFSACSVLERKIRP